MEGLKLMYWWQIKHRLDYHGESITEVSYVQARTTIDALNEFNEADKSSEGII
jgi:hypothetical protein